MISEAREVNLLAQIRLITEVKFWDDPLTLFRRDLLRLFTNKGIHPVHNLKLNPHKTFRRRRRRFIYVQFTSCVQGDENHFVSYRKTATHIPQRENLAVTLQLKMIVKNIFILTKLTFTDCSLIMLLIC